VSDRALVAYERPDGDYDCHEARWTDGLGARLTARTPFGGRGRPVDPSPTERGVPRDDLPGRVEFGRHEAFLVVGHDHEVTTFLALPFGLPEATTDGGALVESRGLLDGAYLHGWVRGFRAALADVVCRDVDDGTASGRLRAEAEGFAGEGRTVHVVEGGS
jgi:hypothetical protein